MIFFSVCAFLNAFTSIFACLFVLFNNPRSKTNRTFAYYAFFVAVWAGCQFMWINAANGNNSLFYMRTSNLAAFFISTTFFHFTCHLVNKYKQHANIIKILYAFNLSMVPLAFTPLFIASDQPQLMFPHWSMAGPLFILLFIEYIVIVCFSLILIHKQLKNSVGSQHQQLKYVFWGILIAYVSGITNFPLCYGIPIPPFANIFIPLYTIFITYAIFKYQLMDIKIIIKKSIVYSALITIITLFGFLSIYLTEHMFREMLGYRSLLISMTLASIITLIFIPLRNAIQSFIEKNLFKGSFVELAQENELLRQEILQTERLRSISILASGMAHEIKNPLTAIKTFTEYLPKRSHDKAFLEKYAAIVSHEVHRIDTLVHELLEFAKPAPAELKPTQIHLLLDQTLEFLNNDLIKHKVTLNKAYQLNYQSTLLLDGNQLKQALLNILLNAIEAMPDGGTLTVSTCISHNAIIRIQDSGNGISQEDLSHIFDPFFTKKDNGTGLGLAITHEIIKNHNGKIFAESRIGKGTTFTIELPL